MRDDARRSARRRRRISPPPPREDGTCFGTIHKWGPGGDTGRRTFEFQGTPLASRGGLDHLIAGAVSPQRAAEFPPFQPTQSFVLSVGIRMASFTRPDFAAPPEPGGREREEWAGGCRGDALAEMPLVKPRAQLAFKDSMIRGILQFTLRIAFRCVLHRCRSQDIRC